MNKLIGCAFLLNIFCFVSCSQTNELSPINEAKLDSLFADLYKHNLGMGSIAISKDGELLYQNAFGYALLNQLRNVPSSSETYYRIGSVTKMFTAVLTLQLIEEGRLKLNDPLSAYYPKIPNSELITVMNLLNHSSSLSNYADKPFFKPLKYESIPKEKLLEIIRKSEPNFEPGKRYEYSNTNFVLLSLLLENITGTSYEEMLGEGILSEAGLTNTYYEPAADTVRKESKSYKYIDGEWVQQREDIAENHLGAGAIVSTPSDLVKFMDALFTFQLISEESVNKMTTIHQDYGLGIFKFQFGSNTAYGHEGRLNEYYTTLIHFPDRKLSIAYCTNGIGYPRDDIVKAVVNICIDQNYIPPNFSGIKTNEEELIKLTGNYTSSDRSIEVACKVENGKLMVETQGMPFETTMIKENYFVNYQFGYFFEFQPDKGILFIKEADNIYTLMKQ